ncbi:hypothetical protein C2E23DRAFT_815980 [Lenzites betulinus]|nr:hypothetical protein C2E23DRAFT_815980 [Lenzites betulinus]
MSPPPSKKMKTDVLLAASQEAQNSAETVPAFPRRAFVEDVSLDILFEVFAQIHPLDLLTLSRTSKTFRTYLMSRRSSLRVWVAARVRELSDAPPCPPHVSEPQYAILLFTQWCTICGEPTDWQKPFWELYARYCPSCTKEQMVRVENLPHDSFEREVKRATAKAGCAGWCIRPACYQWTSDEWHHRQDIVQFKSLWDSCVSLEEKGELIKTSVASVKKWRKETKAIRFWGREYYARLREENIKAIAAKIKEVKRAMQAHWTSCGRRDAVSDTRAEVSDFALKPAWRQLLEAPTSQQITSDDFMRTLDTLEEEWHEARKREFEALVSKQYTGLPADGPPLLSLAISNFYCTICHRKYLRWPNVLAHPCARDTVQQRQGWCVETDRVLSALSHACDGRKQAVRHPWGGNRNLFPFAVMQPTRSALISAQVCGYKLHEVTYETMQRKRFRCKFCTDRRHGYMQVYDWQQMPCFHGADAWAVLGKKYTTPALAAEAALEAAGDVPGAIYGCTRCEHKGPGLRAFRNHCVKEHKIEKPLKALNREDFYLHPTTPTGAHHTISIYPEDARGDRTADKDVAKGHAVFSASLFSR